MQRSIVLLNSDYYSHRLQELWFQFLLPFSAPLYPLDHPTMPAEAGGAACWRAGFAQKCGVLRHLPHVEARSGTYLVEILLLPDAYHVSYAAKI